MKRKYFDIVIKADKEYQAQLMAELMRQLHGILSGLGEHAPNIALSFPYHQHGLRQDQTQMGHIVRVVGDQLSVLQIHRHGAIGYLAESGFFRIKEIEDVPDDAVEVRFVRDRLKEKYAKVRKLYPDVKHETDNICYPYVDLRSQSNKKNFKLYVRMEKAESRVDGQYSTYGLSKEGSTVPFF